jgi:hypothetical protein
MTLTTSARTRWGRLVPVALSAAAIALGTAGYPAIASADPLDFQVSFDVTEFDTITANGDLYVVPAGKKLVVEYVSARVILDAGRRAEFSLNLSGTPEDPQGTRNFVPLAPQREGELVAATGMKLLASADRTLRFSVISYEPGRSREIHVTGFVSGELFDAP